MGTYVEIESKTYELYDDEKITSKLVEPNITIETCKDNCNKLTECKGINYYSQICELIIPNSGNFKLETLKDNEYSRFLRKVDYHTPQVCAKDYACFNANYECSGCCKTGLANNGASCWVGSYTRQRCCNI